jgi:hypothetical protein
MFHNLTIGELNDKKTVDNIKEYVINNYASELKERPSFHKYIVNLPQKFQDLVNKIRTSPEIRKSMCKQYDNCDLTPLENTDELYVSHYNIDGGGDQGLFNKHYDGVLRLINDAAIARVLVYINSKDEYVVHFLDSDISHNFKTYEYGILDFNREYHYVEGKYDKNIDINDTRILLKLNYLICPKCSNWYSKFIIYLNLYVFYIVKKSMEYSKSPKTLFQHIIGFLCNLFRIVNNISVYLTILLIAFIFLLIFLLIYLFIYLFKNKKNIKYRSRK